MKVVAGIDIGGTGTKFGLVDEKGACQGIDRILTRNYPDPEEFVNEISRRILKMSEGYQLLGLGIGAPNANYYDGTIDKSPNLPWKGTIPLAGLFQKHISLPCIMTNDANAAAIGEMLFGSAKEMDDFIFVTLGTGLGSGIVANRQLVYGHDGLAAELGHIIVEKNGRTCGCGRKGCLETYASATGIKRTITEWMSQGKKSNFLEAKATISSADIFEAARNGDLLSQQAFEFTGEILGMALANSVAYTSPKAIFLFGGLANSKNLLFDPTRKHFEANLMNVYRNKISILPSGLKEDEAAILGAAALLWNQNKFF
jgi:glucokinase